MGFATVRNSINQVFIRWEGSSRYLFAVFIILAADVVSAAEWKASTGLRVGEVFTDNIRLTDSDKDSEFVTTVTPNINLEGKGSRANIKLIGAVEFNNLGGDAENYNPELQADGDIELIEDLFFVEGNTSARQTAIDPFSASGDTSINERNNTTTTYQYSVSPYFTTRLKKFAVVQVRYRYDEQINREGEVDDSSRESASFNFNSGNDFTTITWGLLGSWSKTDFDDRSGEIATTESSDNEFKSATLRLGYKINRKWQLTTSYGKEWNDFISSSSDVDDDFWSLGFVWTPTPRTNLEVDYGERFFGDTPALKFTHKHKRSTIEINYLRELTDSRSIRQQQSVLSDINSALLQNSFNLTTPFNSTLENEQFDLSYRIKGKRTSADISIKQSRQTRQEVENSETTFNRIGIGADRRLSTKLSLNARISWDERENEQNEKADTYRYSLGFTQKVGSNTNLSLNYTFSQRDSDLADDDYDENRIDVSIRRNF